jgi:hypothetical protein
MKKLLVGLVAILAMGSMAAGQGFVGPVGPVVLAPGVPQEITIGTTVDGAVQGMNLYMLVGAPVQITNVKIDNEAGLLFFGNTTGANIDIVSVPHEAYCSVTTNTGTVTLDGIKAAARVTVLLPVGEVIPDGGVILTTDYPGAASDWGGIPATQQANVLLTPEPASLLLLLGALPLLRRRRA